MVTGRNIYLTALTFSGASYVTPVPDAYASCPDRKRTDSSAVIRIHALSDWVSARTYKRYSKSVNAQAPKVDKKKVNLGLCSSQKLKSSLLMNP